MGFMFYDAVAFNQPLNDWDVSSVTTMAYMFYHANDFNQPLNAWDVSSVTSMRYVFYCSSGYATCAFNQPLNDWDVSSVTNMEYMFWYAAAFDQDLGWCLPPNARTTDAFFKSGCDIPTRPLESCGVNP